MIDQEHLWDETVAAVEKMPADLKILFSDRMAEIAEDAKKEPEKDVRKQKVKSTIEYLKKEWTNLPDELNRGHFHSLCAHARGVWQMLDQLDEIERIEKDAAAVQAAQKILDAGFHFESVKIDGKTLYKNQDGKVSFADPNGIPF